MVSENTGSDRSEMTGFSVRLEAKQRELIEEAAALEGMNTGAFMRDASVRRAFELLNSSGEQRERLADLARKVVGHLLDVKTNDDGCVVSPLYKPERVDKDGNPYDHADKEWEYWGWTTGIDYRCSEAVKRALKGAGGVFSRMILEEWEARGSRAVVRGEDYELRFSMDDIGSDMGKDLNE